MRLGFTDHDRDLTFDGTTFEAAAGFTASEIKDQVGLAVDNLEVSSALSSGRLEEHDLASGAWDEASVEIFRVNWAEPDQRVLMRSGSLGEVRRAGPAFTAEVRGLAHYLQQPKGRLFQYACDADLGDARCGVALSDPQYRTNGAVAVRLSNRRYVVSGAGSFADGWFARGLLTFTSGAAIGFRSEVKTHVVTSTGVEIELWQEPAVDVAVGDAFSVSAGCDKHLETCRTKFSNVTRFRGFPHMPGNDFVTSFAGRR
jgi:uncharacterized phage protein (TIGR02218 family)